jgi:subtilisin-like proprotein convertase family protein
MPTLRSMLDTATRILRASGGTLPVEAFEALEPRALLSAELPAGAQWMDWGNERAAVREGAWVLTLDGERNSQQRVESLTQQIAGRLGITASNITRIGDGRYATFTTSDVVSFDSAQWAVSRVSGVRWIEPSREYQLHRLPNDDRFSEQWQLLNNGQIIGGVFGTAGADVSAEQAWDITIGSRSVVIAVIDSGVDITHPDLLQNIYVNPGEIPGNGIDDDGNGYIDDVNGFDFGEQDNNPADLLGHGTLVAGTIGAVGNNGTGVAGVAWNVSLLPLKIADATGGLSTPAIIGAHDYATMMRNRGVNIVASNNSYGGFANAFYANAPQGFVAERDAIERFINSGGAFVAAAGNNAFDNDNPGGTFFPSSYNIPGVISVAASDNNDGMAVFSNYGVQTVDLAAPGVQVFTTAMGGGYQAVNGTSFSSPMVAGAIALLKTIKPSASPVELREALINSVDRLPAFQNKVRSGGRMNVARALEMIGIEGPAVSFINPGPVTGQLDPSTNTPINSIRVNFTKDIDATLLSTAGVTLRGNGVDNVFGNGDDNVVTIASIAAVSGNPRAVNIGLNLTGFALQRLPIDQYRLTLVNTAFRDTAGNRLNGNQTTGSDHVYDFEVRSTTGENEPNDTIAQATPVVFDASGQARFTGATVGNGLFGNLDVDLYRVNLSRGGQITAETFAQRLAIPSSLDSVLRLFDASGAEIARNDQTSGNDSFIDFFVPTGGFYYIGVSGFGNANYNPALGGSGASQSLGVYDLRVTIQLSRDDARSYNSTANGLPGQPSLPVPIPFTAPPNGVDTSGVTTSSIVVTDTREILDVNVRFNLQHDFDGDLRISLISPQGTEVIMVDRRGGAGDNFGVPTSPFTQNTIIDDEATTPISAGTAPFVGSYRPDNALSAFDGQRANGTWTLRIVDTTPLNFGSLNYWVIEFVLQNDIFGPFESNDTLVTAKSMTEINGSGTATRTAFIGDGGFGNLDRDIFRFVADSGTSLVASVTSAGALNTALRLFNASGGEVFLSNPESSNNAQITYVFATGGTFYLAISEASNIAYNPGAVNDGTGIPAVTTGNYTLNVTLAPGVSDAATTLSGNPISVAIGSDGNLGTGAGGTRLSYNGIEFLSGRTDFFGAGFGGYAFTNGTIDQLPVSLTSSGDTYNNRLSVKGSFRGLSLERTLSYGVNDSFAVIDVYLRNTTTSTMAGLSWMEAFNPDPGMALLDNSRATRNDVDNTRPMASARYVTNVFPQGLTVALAGVPTDARAKAGVLSTTQSVRDPAQLLGLINGGGLDPDGTTSDSFLTLAYNLGDLDAGAATNFRYFIFFGTSSGAVDTLYQAVQDGTGAGHLTANSAAPLDEALQTGGAPASAPTLPYRQYYPEGFFGDNIYTFIPIANPNDQATRVVVIARYETGARDQIVGELTIAANSRSGLTITTPELFQGGGALAGRPNTPYALEVRAERPVAAMFSHYDLALLDGYRAALGESFTTRVDTRWTFGKVTKGSGNTQFILFYNTTSQTQKVTAWFYPTSGGTPIRAEFTSPGLDGLEGFRRGGFAINDVQGLSNGDYGVVVECAVPIVASLSSYNPTARTAEGVIGNSGLGTTTGIIPEGQFGLNGTSESIGILNANSSSAQVIFSFLFSNGSAYRHAETVAANSSKTLNVGSLPDFPQGTAYGVFFESNVAVAVNAQAPIFNDGVSTAQGDRAYTLWGFGEGFRPGDNSGHPGVPEYLRLYNPSPTDTVVEITITYDGVPGSDVFRRTLPARRVTELNLDQFVVGNRRLSNQWYGTFIKAPTPIVAYFAHWDRSFPGAFGTLGTPLGNNLSVT